MRILIMVILFSWVAIEVHAENYETIVFRAFESNERTSDDDLAFTETFTADGLVRISRFELHRPNDERWSLTSIDESLPTAEEIESFLEEKKASDSSEPDGEGFGSGFVAPGSLQLLEETAAKYRFSFLPIIDEDSEDAELMRHVNGVLSIDKSAGYVDSIDLISTISFSPERGVKIKLFEMSMKFGPTSADGQIVLLLMRVRVQGRAFLMFKFDEVEETIYSDFVRVNE